jgi:DNA-binding phage protein
MIANGTSSTQAAVNTGVASPGTPALAVTVQQPATVLGNVGGYTTVIKDTTAVSSSPAYTAGDAVGGKRTIANAVRTPGTGILESITILDRANQKAGMTLFIFDADPTVATITDNAAFVFSTDDLKVIAQINIGASDYVTTNSKAIAQKTGLGVALKAASGTTLYAALVTTGTPTFAATTDVQLEYGILQD